MTKENKISKNIKKLKQDKGLLQDQLSKLANVSYNSVIKLETGGITNLTTKTSSKNTKALGIGVEDLIK